MSDARGGEVVDLFAPSRGRDGSDPQTRADPEWKPRSDYDPNEFYIRSEKKGQSQSVTLRLQPDLARSIAVTVQSGQYPYHTNSDFIRDAIVHRMTYLAEQYNDAALHQFVKIEMAQAKVDRRHAEIQANARLVDSTKSAAAIALDAEDWGGLAILISDSWDIIDDLRHPYAGQLKAAVRGWERRFPPGYVYLITHHDTADGREGESPDGPDDAG